MKTTSLFLMTILIVGANALNCFQCRSANPNDCKAPGSLRRQVACPPENFNYIAQFCGFKIYRDIQLQANFAVSGCASAPKPFDNRRVVDFCLPGPNQNVLECRICSNNYCNEA